MKYVMVARLALLRWFAYPLEIGTEFVKYAIKLGALFIFWAVVTEGNQSLDTEGLFLYFLITGFIGFITMSRNAFFGREMRHAIMRGQYGNVLRYPISAPLYYYAKAFGDKGITIAISAIGFIVGLFFLSDLSVERILVFLLLLVFSMLLGFSVNLLEGSLSFIFTEITGVKNAFYHVTRLLSGALVPLTFFPDDIRRIVELTPFPAMVFGPAQALLTADPVSDMKIIMLSGGFWSLVILVFAWSVYHFSLRKYQVFGV